MSISPLTLADHPQDVVERISVAVHVEHRGETPCPAGLSSQQATEETAQSTAARRGLAPAPAVCCLAM